MTVVELMGWVSMVLVVIHVHLVGSVSAKWRMIGFGIGIVSCGSWAYVGWMTDQNYILALQAVMFVVILRGFRNQYRLHRREQGE